MKNVLSKLKDHTKEINAIMLRAQSSFRIMDYLYRTSEGLEIEIIRNHQFLKYTAELNWRIYVIELSKLLKPNPNKDDYYNLTTFISKFKQGQEYEMIPGIDNETITKWEDSLKDLKEQIQNLLEQRDKLYSHTDKKHFLYKNKLSFADANELILVIQRVINEIYIKVFGHSASFDPLGEPVDNLKQIVGILVEQKKSQIKALVDHGRSFGIDPKEFDVPPEYLK
ncbi:hypothetical protein PV783_24700 [Chitinophaga sp. CC14]|uniref:AbiU2 domain-containing protein n=1 Tax=Chitinophaga sp. CC14 TaxID=3029199 RepID=UPI003B76D182